MSTDERHHLLDVNGCLVGRGLQHVRLIVEIGITLRIDERNTTAGILSVFEGLEICDAAAMAPQTAHGKVALGKNLVELFTKLFTMEYHLVVQAILLNQRSIILCHEI